MRNLSFTLSPAELETIGDALYEQDEVSEMTLMFSLLESQGKNVNISVNEDEIELDLGDLINDLGLEAVSGSCGDNCTCHDDMVEEADFGDVAGSETGPILLDPKVAMMEGADRVMVQDSTPVMVSGGDLMGRTYNDKGQEVKKTDDGRMVTKEEYVAEVKKAVVDRLAKEDVADDDEDFLTQVDVENGDSVVPASKPKTVIAGWDSRVPRPVPDPDLMAKVNPVAAAKPYSTDKVATPTTGFNPNPNDKDDGEIKAVEPGDVPNKPTPAPKPVTVMDNLSTPEPTKPAKVVEPDLDKDEVCTGCGGFLSVNPHSDPKMNCDCTDDPYFEEEEMVEDPIDNDVMVKGQEDIREQVGKPDDLRTTNEPSGWTTVDPNVWRT